MTSPNPGGPPQLIVTSNAVPGARDGGHGLSIISIVLVSEKAIDIDALGAREDAALIVMCVIGVAVGIGGGRAGATDVGFSVVAIDDVGRIAAVVISAEGGTIEFVVNVGRDQVLVMTGTNAFCTNAYCGCCA